jgi:hypothetical protein
MKTFAVGLVVGALVALAAVGAWVVAVGRVEEAD